jgi:hypothetical protein
MKRAWLTLMVAGLFGGGLRAGEFEFVVIGDTRPRFESENFRVFDSLIAQINTVRPALVINLGDLIYGYGPLSKEKQWDKYQQVIKGIVAPYYQVPGNHDTHSKAARRIYGRRFGRFYQSFDYGKCHFILLDNTEDERWGRIGPAELAWLKQDLQTAQSQSVFVFLHFPVWEPERVAPAYYEFWRQNLHPLFKAANVRAVFAGHYHSYGPTRTFDGIRYYITGGGGAELKPEYKRSGGEHHFLRVKVAHDSCEVRVVTPRGELTDAEADVMGGLQFAERNSSRIGLPQPTAEQLMAGFRFSVWLTNPYLEPLVGDAEWVFDGTAFSVQPPKIQLRIAPGATLQEDFLLTAFQAATPLESRPRLQFNAVSGGRHHRFHREVWFLQKISVAYDRAAPDLDGDFRDWIGCQRLDLCGGTEPGAQLLCRQDRENLYLALAIPTLRPEERQEEEEEAAQPDALQIGLARRLSPTDFGGDFLRFGFNPDSNDARNRTPGRKAESIVPGVRVARRVDHQQTNYEIGVPLRLLRHMKSGGSDRLILNLSFPVPDRKILESDLAKNEPTLFSYYVRYGSADLAPVRFVELELGRNR